jgi:hypothetical protein
MMQKWFAIGSAVLASVLGMLQYFGVAPSDQKPSSEARAAASEQRPSIDNSVNVTSINQSGGVTAHTVNMGPPPPRQMHDELGAKLKQVVPANSKVAILSVMGDNEAFVYANSVKNWMVRNGYSYVDGVGQIALGEPRYGQAILQVADGFQLIIGSRPLQ